MGCHTRSSQLSHAASSKARNAWAWEPSRMRRRSSSRTTRPSGHRTRPGTGSSTEHRRSQLPPPPTCRLPPADSERSGSTSNPKSSWTGNGSRRFQVMTAPSHRLDGLLDTVGGPTRGVREVPGLDIPTLCQPVYGDGSASFHAPAYAVHHPRHYCFSGLPLPRSCRVVQHPAGGATCPQINQPIRH